MIGNNACGSRALGYGRTADNVVALDGADGRRAAGGRRGARGSTPSSTRTSATIRPRFGRFSRQVSGYSLEHLLPEHGRSLDRFLVGSEGTLAVVTAATVRLVEDAPVPGARGARLPVDGRGGGRRTRRCWRTDPSPARAWTSGSPRWCRRHPELPRGERLAARRGDRRRRAAEATARAPDACRRGQRGGRPPGRHRRRRAARAVADPRGRRRARLAGHRPAGAGRLGGRRGAARPARRLPARLRRRCSCSTGFTGVPYGHFGDGCVHVRIDFDLVSGPGRAGYRAFVEEAARLAASYGGSLSGEHGDGRARSELLPLMYDERGARPDGRRSSGCFDPANLLNPGVLVDPAPLDADLRLAGVPADRPRTVPAAARTTAATWSSAVHRCTGVGKCLADNTGAGGVMCPSYQATREEKDSTRGRARVLQDAVTGRLAGGLGLPGARGGARPVPGLQGLRPRLPDRRRHGDLQGRVAAPEVRRQAAAAHPLQPRAGCPQLVAKVPPRLANAGLRLAPALARCSPASTAAGRCRGSPRGRSARVRSPPVGRRRRGALGRHVHQPVRARRSPTPPSRCSRPPAQRVQVRGATATSAAG